MLNNKTISVLKRISKEASSRPVLKNYSVKEGVLWMTDGKKAIWTPSNIEDGLYNMDGENVTETAGTYPDIKRLIPSDHKATMRVNDVKNLLEFMKAYVKLHGLKRSDRELLIKLALSDNKAKLTGCDEFKAVSMTYNLSCDDMTDSNAYYNPFYLIDVLEFISANIDDNTAVIKYHSRMHPLVIESENGTGALLMPIRKH